MLRSTVVFILGCLSLGCASVPGSYTDFNVVDHHQHLAYAQAEFPVGFPADRHYLLPEVLSITIHIDNYEIVDFRVNSDNFHDFPNIKFGDRYSDGHIILMSFFPSPAVNGSYWLAKVPPIRSGVETIKANLYRHSVTLGRGLLPPDVVVLDLSIRNGTVERVYIENALENTVGLRYEKPQMVNGNRYGVISSRMFPYETWHFRFPSSDGRFNIAVRKTAKI